jgi:hypothetical protein
VASRGEFAVTDPAEMPVRGSAAPAPKIATVRAPGGGRLRETQGASLGAWPAASCAGPPGASQAPVRLSALRHPLIRVSEAKRQNPGRKNAPRERGGLSKNERLPQVDGGGAKKQRREPSGRLQRQNSPSGEGCASENGIASCWTGPMPASGP